MSVAEEPAHKTELPPVQRRDGVRVVTRNNGQIFDLMPSPHSRYLLPPLADCSLLRREFQSPAGSVRFEGESIELRDVTDLALAHVWREMFSRASAGVGGLGQYGGVTVGSPVWLSGGPIIVHEYGYSGVSRPDDPPALGVEISGSDPAEQSVSITIAAEVDPGPAPVTSLAGDASVADLASRVAELSALSDERLAVLFKVKRETFCRWRTGVLTNPRVGNRRRLGLLLALFEDLDARHVNVKDWLWNSAGESGLTPYDLISQGRLDEAAFLAASVGEQPVERDVRIADRIEPGLLTFGDDDVWEFDESDDDEP